MEFKQFLVDRVDSIKYFVVFRNLKGKAPSKPEAP